MERLNMGLTIQAINQTERIPSTLLGLQKKFLLLRPIHEESDYQNGLEVATDLASRADLTAEQADYLEVLTTLIADYEERHLNISKHSPQELLK
ncbi:MAG: hypothetical protein ACYTBS_21770, partial [Planctomycetota bacterium]